MKALSVKIEGQTIELPSHVDLVSGLSDYVDNKIDAYDQGTLSTRIAGLSSVYLGINDKAKDSDKADYATGAGRATADGAGNNIEGTYYKKTETVTRATNDSEGNAIHTTYAKINGWIEEAKHATLASGADRATLDGTGANIANTYIKGLTVSGTTITYQKGNGQTGTITTKDTTYANATSAAAGLMSSDDKIKLNGIAAGATNTPAIPDKAKALNTARTIKISGGGVGSTTFDGSADANIVLGTINASSITSGALATARGGTGQTDGTVAKLHTARTINGVEFDGSANVLFSGVCDTAADDPAKTVVVPNFKLTTGAIVAVQFNKANTAAGTITLNVNETGAYPIRRRNGATSTFNKYDYHIRLFRFDGNYWRIIEDTPLNTIKLTGVVTGESTIGVDSTLTINAAINQKSAFESKRANPEDFDSDMNNIKDAGFWRITALNKWKNRPEGTTTQAYYMQVYESSVSSTFIQVLMHAWAPNVYYRMAPNGNPGSWAKVNVTTVDTIATISGDTNDANDAFRTENAAVSFDQQEE